MRPTGHGTGVKGRTRHQRMGGKGTERPLSLARAPEEEAAPPPAADAAPPEAPPFFALSPSSCRQALGPPEVGVGARPLPAEGVRTVAQPPRLTLTSADEAAALPLFPPSSPAVVEAPPGPPDEYASGPSAPDIIIKTKRLST